MFESFFTKNVQAYTNVERTEYRVFVTQTQLQQVQDL